MRHGTLLLLTIALSFTTSSRSAETKAAPSSEGSPYLFVWAGDAARQSSDFLAVIDANPSSANYGRIVSTVPAGATATVPHHTEYEFPPDNLLFADGWVAGRTFIFDLNQPSKPRLAEQFVDRAGYTFPHSYARLANGHRLATFQSHGEGYAPGGGLVELDANGSAIRSVSALDPAVDKDLIWPYSLAIAPQLDRVIVSSTPMGWPKWATLPPGSWPFKKINTQVTAQVQIFRLSDLHLLNTVTLPSDGPAKHDEYPAEPRVLSDGTVYVNTFNCGLYRMKDVSGPRPSAELVYTFPGGDTPHTLCAVPVVIGHYWVQTVPALPGLIALDVSHPEKPVEVSRLTFDKHFAMPHWMAADRKSNRLVVTGMDQSWVLVARFDPDKGTLSLDPTFHEPGANHARNQFRSPGMAAWKSRRSPRPRRPLRPVNQIVIDRCTHPSGGTLIDRRRFLTAASSVAAALTLPRTLFAQLDNVPALPDHNLYNTNQENYWAELRRQFLIPADEIYLNNGTVGSSPAPVLRAIFNAYTQTEKLDQQDPED